MDWFVAPLHQHSQAKARFFWLLRRLLIMDGLLLAGYGVAVLLFWAGATSRIVYMLDIGSDRTLAEWANYLKWAACLFYLIQAWTARREPILLACLPVFLGILIDDAFQYHESRGVVYERLLALQPHWGLHASGVGQLIAFALMGLVSLLILGIGYATSAAAGRAIGRRFLVLFAALIVVGVAVDALHEAVGAHMPWRYGGLPGILLTVLEEGGELVLASLAMAFSAGLAAVRAPASAAQPRDRAAGP